VEQAGATGVYPTVSTPGRDPRLTPSARRLAYLAAVFLSGGITAIRAEAERGHGLPPNRPAGLIPPRVYGHGLWRAPTLERSPLLALRLSLRATARLLRACSVSG
jgi:hypothetical protein